MPETDEQRQERLLRELEGKNVSHYSVMLSAWIETRMERDRTLVTLSAAAIGLIVTILTTAGVSGWVPLLLIVLSLSGFGLCIWSALVIYQLNAEHIEKEIREESDSSVNLEKFDKRSVRSFIAGVIFFVLFGVSSAIVFLGSKEQAMAKGNGSNTGGQSEMSRRSLNGIGQLRPQNPSGQSGGSQGNGTSTGGAGNSGGATGAGNSDSGKGGNG